MKRSKLLSLFLSVLMVFSLGAMSAAAAAEKTPAENGAEVLYELGLFQGVGDNGDGSPNFDLDRAPSREEAVTMLVRLLGKDADATAGTWSIPFTDVSDWAKPYVGYAYDKKLTFGVSGSTFGGGDTVTATQYLTFVLRALGYSSGEDFEWNAAWDLTNALEITRPGEYDASTTRFTRGDVAIISATSLGASMKNSAHNLLSYLNSSGALAETNLVIMKLEVLACQENRMEFVFFPVTGSPNNYVTFKVNSVTVNGLPCTVSNQYSSNKEATAASESLKNIYPDTFNYTVLSYDQAKAEAAAKLTVDLGGNNSFPVLIFSFDCTGTLADGTKVSEVFSEAVYIDGYGSVA